ncbi:hypothetical protein CPB84DRAFT_1769478, partial [Gymnopilus junonius]
LLRSCLSPLLLWILLPPALQLSSCLPQVRTAAPLYWLPTRMSHSETKAKTRISQKGETGEAQTFIQYQYGFHLFAC